MENSLNKTSEENIIEHEKVCASLGLKSALRGISDGLVDISVNQIKVNLPGSIEAFSTGNGEGIWAVPFSQKDLEVYNNEEVGQEFEVIILNTPITYPFRWGSVITVKNTSKDTRPVLSKGWIEKVIYDSTKGAVSLKSMLGE